MRTNETKNTTDETEKSEEKIKQKDLKYETNKNTYDFQQYESIRSFGDSIYTPKTNIVETEKNWSNLLKNVAEFSDKSGPRSEEGKDKKRDTYESARTLYESRELTLNTFKSGVFPLKESQGKGLKMSTPKEMLQRLPIAESLIN